MEAEPALGQSVQRYYDPVIPRFLSVDPVTAYDDPIGAFHRYRYANNNPYRFTDPDGRLAGIRSDWRGDYYQDGLGNRRECNFCLDGDGKNVQSSGSSDGWPNGEFTKDNWSRRVGAAKLAVQSVRGSISEIMHDGPDAQDDVARTFNRVIQPISTRYGVEIEAVVDGIGAYFVSGLAVGTRPRMISGLYIGYTVDGGVDPSLRTMHAHPIITPGAEGYTPFSAEDIDWYGATRTVIHYVSDPSGVYRYNGLGVAPTRIGE